MLCCYDFQYTLVHVFSLVGLMQTIVSQKSSVIWNMLDICINKISLQWHYLSIMAPQTITNSTFG